MRLSYETVFYFMFLFNVFRYIIFFNKRDKTIKGKVNGRNGFVGGSMAYRAHDIGLHYFITLSIYTYS